MAEPIKPPPPLTVPGRTEADAIAERTARPIITEAISGAPVALTPAGWTVMDLESYLPRPRRKHGTLTMHDTESFICAVNRHDGEAAACIYVDANFPAGKVSLTAVLNDHAGGTGPGWRDHRVIYTPEKSVEWLRWIGKNKEPMSQLEFAVWLEDNLTDIATVEGLPTGSQMREMALQLEARQDMRLKSGIRLQSGSVSLEYVEDDAATVERMSMFERFALGIAPFRSGAPYQVDARLRYRIKEGRAVFWFELIRHDRVLEAAARDIVTAIQDRTDFPVLFGVP